MSELYEHDNAYAHGRALVIGFLVAVPLLSLAPRSIFHYVWHEHFIVEDLNRDKQQRLSRRVQEIPPPRLQYEPHVDLDQFRSRQLQELGSYGWIDKNQGTARIPIDEAMTHYLETAPQP